MPNLLELPISRDQLYRMCAECSYDEEIIDRVLNKRGLSDASIGLALDLHQIVTYGISFSVIMREELLPALVIHRLSIRLGALFLAFAKKRNAYVDFRTPQLLEKKTQWLDGTLSYGDYRLAVRRAEDARMLVNELHEPLVTAAADVIVHVGSEDARTAFRSSYNLASAAANDPLFDQAVLESVKEALGGDLAV
jgi:hypothetical protein